MSFNQDLMENKSPFRLPTDEEVFITREAERLRKQEEKDKVKELKIWDKQTACTKGQLKRPTDNDFNTRAIEDSQLHQFVRPKERNLITAALEIVNQRSKLPQNQKSENIREYVEQKKEIFRVEMKYRILKDEREKIKDRIQNKQKALKRNEEFLTQDNERFTKHIDDNKKQKDNALKSLNDEIQLKKERDAEIKQLEQRKAAISAEISRNEELLESLKKHKQFLDKLTPADFLAEQEKNLQEAYKRVKADWIREQKNFESMDLDPEVDSQHSGGTNHSNRKKRPDQVSKLEKKFDDLFKRGKIEEVYRQANEKMYFHDERLLLDILKELEDNNLFLIELIQEMDHQLEISKSELDNFKRKREKKWEETIKEKEQLATNLKGNMTKMKVTNKKIQTIQNKKENNRAAQNLKEEIGKFITAIGYENDSGLQPIEMLKIIEDHVNPLLAQLKLLITADVDLFIKLVDEKNEEKKEQRIQEQIERKREEDKIKGQKAKEREERKNPKKLGRQYMNKVLHQKKNVEREVKEVYKTEEELIRDFIEETTS